ncbi:MAG: alpha/beta hydrolase [Actinomycetota bacterium]
MSEPLHEVIDLGDQQLTAARWGAGPIGIVMLHDGLGSISQWRSVPAEVAARTGRTVLAYERAGHGTSVPVPTGAWPADWLHREADVLGRVLEALDLDDLFLVGHSDGGSTALIHACEPARRITGVIAIAPHTWVEDICWTSIVEMRAQPERLVAGLARHHAQPEAVFEAWSGVWVSDEFRRWDIRPMLHRIDVPTVIAQGTEDPYASAEQVHASVAAIGGNASSRFLEGLGHIAHHDDAGAVVDAIVDAYDASA